MTGPFPGLAPALADLGAVAEVGLATLLILGALLVRRGHIRAHKQLQSAVVLGNLPIAIGWMVPRYLAQVLPGLPGEIAEPFYLLPTLMLVVGAAAEGLGLFILLVAGTAVVPERWRFRDYKRWMRSELVLWWAVVALGLGTYLTWYG